MIVGEVELGHAPLVRFLTVPRVTPEQCLATQADLARLEQKLDALMVALRAGAIGKWTP